MTTTVNALKELYVKLGGALTDTYDAIADGVAVKNYTTIPDCIEAVEQIAKNGGELPKVTATDNGKVLLVSGGAWNKGDLPQKFAVDFTVTLDGETLVGTADKTFAQVKAAFLAGTEIEAAIDMPSGQIAYSGVRCVDSKTEPTVIAFSVVLDLSGSGETPAPSLYQIAYSASGVAVAVVPLTVAS